ncbi:MAG TPA: ankyrin repeat domain-containing protein [Thioalkalivibrio sp.]|nr:ankyrin repeat domain-containing protein [Thioalkalivibrio sp.]
MNRYLVYGVWLLLMASSPAWSSADAERLLLQAAADGDAARVTRLIKEGADVNQAHRPWELTPLLVAVGAGEAVTRVLIRAGADVNAADREGVTVLMKAVHGGDPAVVRRLLEEPALMVDTPGPRGNTALTYAILYGHAEMVEALIARGADVNVARANGTTPKAIADHMHELALAMPEGDADQHAHHPPGPADHGHHLRTRAEAVASYTRVLAVLDEAGAVSAPRQCHHDRGHKQPSPSHH